VLVPVRRGRIAAGHRAPEARVEEAAGLARAIDLDVLDALAVPIAAPRPATLFGSGKVEEIATRVAAEAVALVVVDGVLSPVQQRNLERAWKCKVIDRTGLILEIFGERARTAEGALQVELAHLGYQKSRLVRSWTHLERQRGGFGFLGGPGETQIEADRRALEERIARIERDLEAVATRRRLQRKTRKKASEGLVALVGYELLQGRSSTIHTPTPEDNERSRDAALGIAITPLALPGLSDLPLVGKALFGHNPLVYASLALFAAIQWFLYRSRPGLVVRAVGENPQSAHAIGYPVVRIRYLAVMFGGACAGIGGAYLSLVYTPQWTEAMTAGRGWIAIALVVFGTWLPGRIAIGALLFGAVNILQLHAQAIGLGIPSQFLSSLPYLVTIIALVVISRNQTLLKVHTPACLGRTFVPDN